MNRVPVVVALSFALVGIVLLLVYKQRFESQATGGERISVLVVTQEIPAGARITEEMLGTHAIPEAYVEERHVRSGDAHNVLGIRTAATLKPDESLLWSDLETAAGQARKLAALVRVGMRAVSLDVADGAFGGLLRPGDRVDVVLTSEDKAHGGRRTIPVAQNLIVLAVGDDTGGEVATAQRARGSRVAVTLGTNPADGQRLILASSEGHVRLLLRNPEDVRVVQDMPEIRTPEVVVPTPQLDSSSPSNGARNHASALAQARKEVEKLAATRSQEPGYQPTLPARNAK